MSIKHISTNDLRRMRNSEGLILQGCGGDLQEWVDGINEMLTEEGKKLLVTLPDSERQLIDALFTQGLSEREWSAQTGISQKTINNRKRSLLLKLRKIFEK